MHHVALQHDVALLHAVALEHHVALQHDVAPRHHVALQQHVVLQQHVALQSVPVTQFSCGVQDVVLFKAGFEAHVRQQDRTIPPVPPWLESWAPMQDCKVKQVWCPPHSLHVHVLQCCSHHMLLRYMQAACASLLRRLLTVALYTRLQGQQDGHVLHQQHGLLSSPPSVHTARKENKKRSLRHEAVQPCLEA